MAKYAPRWPSSATIFIKRDSEQPFKDFWVTICTTEHKDKIIGLPYPRPPEIAIYIAARPIKANRGKGIDQSPYKCNLRFGSIMHLLHYAGQSPCRMKILHIVAKRTTPSRKTYTISRSDIFRSHRQSNHKKPLNSPTREIITIAATPDIHHPPQIRSYKYQHSKPYTTCITYTP